MITKSSFKEFIENLGYHFIKNEDGFDVFAKNDDMTGIVFKADIGDFTRFSTDVFLTKDDVSVANSVSVSFSFCLMLLFNKLVRLAENEPKHSKSLEFIQDLMDEVHDISLASDQFCTEHWWHYRRS